MKFTVPAREFNAVMSCAAVGEQYLNVFFIDIDALRMVATNRHILGETDLELTSRTSTTTSSSVHGDIQGFLFHAFTKPLSATADEVVIDTEALSLTVSGPRYKSNPWAHLALSDAKFLDYTKVSARLLEEGKGSISSIGLNVEYIFRPYKWAHIKNPATYLTFSGDDRSPIKVTYHGLDAVFTLMPLRK